jgi:DNA-directed RNA polymerase subunit RPC12/RpoP
MSQEMPPPAPPAPDAVEPEDVEADSGPATDVDHQFPCPQCGASMSFDPTVTSIKCPYCEHEVAIPSSEADINELDFHTYLQQAASDADTVEAITVTCQACGAVTTLDEHATAGNCPFCGTAIVSEGVSQQTIRPRSLLPFKVTQQESHDLFASWVKSRWFAPNKLKQYARSERGNLSGIYVPYWTYDADTVSRYRGKRGDHYMVSESYTTTENGKTVQKTRQVQKTRWRSVSGVVLRSFDDVLVVATHSLPRAIADKLEPWDMENLVPYEASYLSGFRAERYQVGLEEGFDEAKGIMDKDIRKAIEHDIGGDRQKISSMSTQHNDLTFKHLLLPIWISSYRFHEKTYQFLVNGRTGEVQGERPYSWVKIASLVVGVVALVAGIYFATRS